MTNKNTDDIGTDSNKLKLWSKMYNNKTFSEYTNTAYNTVTVQDVS